MNDERSGLLTGPDYTLPEYAQGMLWLAGEGGATAVEGPRGLFELPEPMPVLSLHWADEDGPALARLPWQPDSLDWDGVVRIGGMIESLHLTELEQSDLAVAVIQMVGQPLTRDATPYLSASQRRSPGAHYVAPTFTDGLSEIPPTTTSWLVDVESPLLTLAQDAMMNDLRLWFSGRLADHGSGWENQLALPLILVSVTLIGT